jgi:ribonuclease HII
VACTFEFERKVRNDGAFLIAGVDEAGRGPLAGPVVACAVILPQDFCMEGLDDSKKLTPLQRERFYEQLTTSPQICWAVAWRDNQAIDRLNILQATYEAMREAVASLSPPPAHVLVDGRRIPSFPIPHTAVVGGDGLSLSIAAASVIAKVTRDRFMIEEADTQYPQYGFRDHKGYGTLQHREKIKEYGPCPLHRLSFAPLVQKEFSWGENRCSNS